MRRKGLFAVGCAAVLVSASGLVGQDAEDTPGEAQRRAEEMARMQKMMEAMSPGGHHEHLAFFVGEWKTKMKVWMGGPGSAAAESAGRSEVKWVLGKRFIFEHYQGTFMGQPFEGMGFVGYDNFRNLYVADWAANTGTHILHMAGTRHPKTGVYTFYGEMDEPALDVVGRTVKYVRRIVDQDTFVLAVFDLHAGDDYKVIEITFTRAGE